ncbi:MAG: zinc-ribbon domain-containing protein, partial [Lachnospiraceae bacterium]|nr:zinc-ribbon domain-containing protein [Lachnospiraceae bacterium]
MAKFCSNCGAQMADDDKVCGQCGTPAVSETTEQAAPEASADTAETPAFDNAS